MSHIVWIIKVLLYFAEKLLQQSPDQPRHRKKRFTSDPSTFTRLPDFFNCENKIKISNKCVRSECHVGAIENWSVLLHCTIMILKLPRLHLWVANQWQCVHVIFSVLLWKIYSKNIQLVAFFAPKPCMGYCFRLSSDWTVIWGRWQLPVYSAQMSLIINWKKFKFGTDLLCDIWCWVHDPVLWPWT